MPSTRTPPEIVELLNREMVKALADPGVKATYVKAGLIPVGMSTSEFRRHLDKESVEVGCGRADLLEPAVMGRAVRQATAVRGTS